MTARRYTPEQCASSRRIVELIKLRQDVLDGVVAVGEVIPAGDLGTALCDSARREIAAEVIHRDIVAEVAAYGRLPEAAPIEVAS